MVRLVEGMYREAYALYGVLLRPGGRGDCQQDVGIRGWVFVRVLVILAGFG